jgi:hypothetical protein
MDLFLVLGLTLVSGWSDSQGFVHASRIWVDGGLEAASLGRSALGFCAGIGAYWLALRFLPRIGVIAPEVQTTLWFAVTIIGVAVTSGAFLNWRRIDQVVSAAVLCGVGWLLLQTSRP